MTTTTTNRSRLLIGLVIALSVAGVAFLGPVAAQDAGDNGTTTGNETGTANGTTMVMGNDTAGTTVAMGNATDGTTVAMGNGTNVSMGNGTNASITADPDSAGATANHTVNVTLSDGMATNLTYIRVNYTGTNASIGGVPDNVQSATLGGQDVAENVTPSTRIVDQAVLNLSFDLNESLQAQPGEEFAMVYEAGNPPEPDTYGIEMTIAAGGTNTSTMANLTITESMATTTTAMGMTPEGTTTTETATGETTTEETTTEETTTEEDMAAQTPTEEDTPAATTTSGNGPGFTVLIAVVGVIAAALLATRRR